ncbi:MAG TPA: FAD-dependent monooxygenase [Paracoccaceae bacterium]|nr:FAD-dependent monooxygenase [Paracoccaceae bacterium]
MQTDTDILIAGGGIAGLTLALALASGGFHCILCDPLPVETRAAPDFDGRAYAIAASCQRMLAALGIWEAIAARSQPMLDIVVTDGRPGEAPAPWFLHFDSREGEEGPFAHMVEDRYLRFALLAHLARTPAVTHLAPASLADHRVEPGGVRAVLADGREITARSLVACDGRRSAIAARAGIDYVSWDYHQMGLVSAVEHERPHEGVAHEYFLPAGPFAILPLPGNRVSLVWTERPAEAAAIHALPDAGYHSEIRRRFGSFLGETRLAGRRWIYPLGLALAQSWVRPRLALLGDAAHGIHPLAGQGLNLGLKDVAALAEVLVEANRRGEDIGALDVLERYQAWRRFDSVAVALACDGLNRLFSNDDPVLRRVRDRGLDLVGRIGPARRFFMRVAAGVAGDVPRLLRGLPL